MVSTKIFPVKLISQLIGGFGYCAVSERDYLRLLREGWIPEQAREVLNNSTKTEIVMTANLRQWRAIL